MHSSANSQAGNLMGQCVMAKVCIDSYAADKLVMARHGGRTTRVPKKLQPARRVSVIDTNGTVAGRRFYRTVLRQP